MEEKVTIFATGINKEFINKLKEEFGGTKMRKVYVITSTSSINYCNPKPNCIGVYDNYGNAVNVMDKYVDSFIQKYKDNCTTMYLKREDGMVSFTVTQKDKEENALTVSLNIDEIEVDI